MLNGTSDRAQQSAWLWLILIATFWLLTSSVSSPDTSTDVMSWKMSDLEHWTQGIHP